MFMSKIDMAVLQRLQVEHPQWVNKDYALHFGTTQEAIRQARKKLAAKLDPLVQAKTNEQLGELAKTTKEQLQNDVGNLWDIAIKELQTAIKNGNKKDMDVWYDKAIANAQLRARIITSLNILIDNRSVNVFNVQGGEVYKCLCPACQAKVKATLLQNR